METYTIKIKPKRKYSDLNVTDRNFFEALPPEYWDNDCYVFYGCLGDNKEKALDMFNYLTPINVLSDYEITIEEA